jgi:hypothetical protein
VEQSSSFSSLRSEKGLDCKEKARSSDCELSQVRKQFTGKTLWINPDCTAIQKNATRLQKIRNWAVILF